LFGKTPCLFFNIAFDVAFELCGVFKRFVYYFMFAADGFLAVVFDNDFADFSVLVGFVFNF
jgi:hypothetical protein